MRPLRRLHAPPEMLLRGPRDAAAGVILAVTKGMGRESLPALVHERANSPPSSLAGDDEARGRLLGTTRAQLLVSRGWVAVAACDGVPPPPRAASGAGHAAPHGPRVLPSRHRGVVRMRVNK